MNIVILPVHLHSRTTCYSQSRKDLGKSPHQHRLQIRLYHWHFKHKVHNFTHSDYGPILKQEETYIGNRIETRESLPRPLKIDTTKLWRMNSSFLHVQFYFSENDVFFTPSPLTYASSSRAYPFTSKFFFPSDTIFPYLLKDCHSFSTW